MSQRREAASAGTPFRKSRSAPRHAPINALNASDALVDALLATCADGVLVCDVDGRVVRHNAEAARLLGAARGAELEGALAYDLLGRPPLAWALEAAALREGETAATAARGREAGRLPLRLRVRLVATGGFVVVMEAADERGEMPAARDEVLQELTEGLRAPLASVRAAIETMMEYPGMDAAVAEQFKEIILTQSVALSEHLEEALAAYSRRAKADWPLAPIAGADLLASIRAAIEARLDVRVCTHAPKAPLYVRADQTTLAQVLARLAQLISNAVRCDAFACRLTPRRPFAALSLAWEGAPISAQRLLRWEAQPIRLEGTVVTTTLREVVDRHGGDVWTQSSEEGRASVRMLLPLASAGDASEWMAAHS